MTAISLLSLLGIVIVMPLLVRSKIRADRTEQEGQNDDYHVIETTSSAFGDHLRYTIPKDRDEYARMFVPKGKK